MGLREVMFDHPAFLGLAILAWIGVLVWVVSLVGWMIQGEIDALFGLAGIAIAFALGYFAFNPPSAADPNAPSAILVRTCFALSTVVTVVIFPIARRTLNQRALAVIDIEAMEDIYEKLLVKPDNHPLRFKLAKLLYERGHVGPAIGLAQTAIVNMPENVFTDEHRMMGRWRRQNPSMSPDQQVVCVNCGTPNPVSEINCQTCGNAYLIDLARGRWLGKEFVQKLIAGWIVGVLALIGIPMAATLPPAPAIALILIIMIGAIVLLWNAFHATGGKAHA